MFGAVYGVDFSGAKLAGRNIWVARLQGGGAGTRRRPSRLTGLACNAITFPFNPPCVSAWPVRLSAAPTARATGAVLEPYAVRAGARAASPWPRFAAAAPGGPGPPAAEGA